VNWQFNSTFRHPLLKMPIAAGKARSPFSF
jgi:hypothetical protein